MKRSKSPMESKRFWSVRFHSMNRNTAAIHQPRSAGLPLTVTPLDIQAGGAVISHFNITERKRIEAEIKNSVMACKLRSRRQKWVSGSKVCAPIA